MGSTRSDISTLAEAILTQIIANATNFNNMSTLMKQSLVNFTQGRTPAKSNPTSFSSKHYCWTHLLSFNKDYTRVKCEDPAECHGPTAT